MFVGGRARPLCLRLDDVVAVSGPGKGFLALLALFAAIEVVVAAALQSGLWQPAAGRDYLHRPVLALLEVS